MLFGMRALNVLPEKDPEASISQKKVLGGVRTILG